MVAVTQRLDVRYGNIGVFLYLFLPWSLAPCVAVFLAIAALRRELDGGKALVRPSEPRRPKLALLAAFFLGWLFQGLFFQLPHLYVLSVTVIPAVVTDCGPLSVASADLNTVHIEDVSTRLYGASLDDGVSVGPRFPLGALLP